MSRTHREFLVQLCTSDFVTTSERITDVEWLLEKWTTNLHVVLALLGPPTAAIVNERAV